MRIAAATIVLACLCGLAVGQIRFPPPEFQSGYKMPSVTTPGAGERKGAYAFDTSIPPLYRYIDAVLLSGMIAMGVYVVLRKAPVGWLVVLGGAVLLFFGLWDQTCKYLMSLAGAREGTRVERYVNLAVPMIVMAGVLWLRRTKRRPRGLVPILVLAVVHVCIWWDGIPGTWGIIRRVGWLAGYEDAAPALPFALEYLDVVLLAGAILATSYLALKVRSRNAIVTVMIFSLLHFGFWRQGCICPIGALQTVTLAIADSAYPISLIVVLFFLLPLVLTVLFGRSFCAAVCPLGAIQDVVVIRPLKLPAWLAHSLGLLAWVYLALAVMLAAIGSMFVICQYDPFVALFRLEGSGNMLLLGASFLVLGVFVARPYCRFLCPYGAILRLLSVASWRRVTITPDECVQCRLCEDSCPFGAIRLPNTDQPHLSRSRGKGVLAGMIVLLPVLVIAGGLLGEKLAAPLARTHETVRLAEQIALEKRTGTQGAIDATDALEAMEESAKRKRHVEIHGEAQTIEGRFLWGGVAFGAFVGLVVALKLIALSVRRTRKDYEADRATCLACGRCFAYCPVELKRRSERKV